MNHNSCDLGLVTENPFAGRSAPRRRFGRVDVGREGPPYRSLPLLSLDCGNFGVLHNVRLSEFPYSITLAKTVSDELSGRSKTYYDLIIRLIKVGQLCVVRTSEHK